MNRTTVTGRTLQGSKMCYWHLGRGIHNGAEKISELLMDKKFSNLMKNICNLEMYKF